MVVASGCRATRCPAFPCRQQAQVVGVCAERGAAPSSTAMRGLEAFPSKGMPASSGLAVASARRRAHVIMSHMMTFNLGFYGSPFKP